MSRKPMKLTLKALARRAAKGSDVPSVGFSILKTELVEGDSVPFRDYSEGPVKTLTVGTACTVFHYFQYGKLVISNVVMPPVKLKPQW